MIPGAEFTVTKVAPLGDPIEVDLGGSRLCLRRSEAADLTFERVG